MCRSLWERRKEVLEMSKHRHDIVIEDDIWKGIKVFIVNKQGEFKKGDISKWISIAINNLLAGSSAHTRDARHANPYQIPKGVLKVRNLMNDICNRWLESGLRQAPINPGNTTIPIKHLEQMIREVTGFYEKRGIRNNIDNLIKHGHITDKGYTGACLILDTGTNLEYIERIMEQQKRDERMQEQEQQSEAIKQDSVCGGLK